MHYYYLQNLISKGDMNIQHAASQKQINQILMSIIILSQETISNNLFLYSDKES
jgi:hypothetical protein